MPARGRRSCSAIALVKMNSGALLRDISSLLEHQRVVETFVSKQQVPNKEVLETMTYRQHQAELQARLATVHPADIAVLLESLPPEDRARVWSQIRHQQGGNILLESSSALRRTLLEKMNREEMLTVLRQVAADDLPELAD